MGLLGCVTGEDSSLDSSTVSDCLVRVNALVRLLAIEEVGDELDNMGDMGGTADEDDLMDIGLVDLRTTKDLLDRLEGTTEKILAELLKLSAGEGSCRNQYPQRESRSRWRFGWQMKEYAWHVRKQYGDDGGHAGWKRGPSCSCA